MADDEKDRLGDKLRDVERAREDLYFAERDRELIAKLRQAKEKEQEETLKELAKRRCPKCGERLLERTLHQVTVEECPSCQGLWLDHGELEHILERSKESLGYFGEWLRRWLGGERDS
ncbi:MAG: hypothetical protein KatS3mg076_3107 [Candidatus Binatia bacterium]|nr:MAG: hypothetical protein KatS3mg076_3107 [Candidatus Binatia bacterium]